MAAEATDKKPFFSDNEKEAIKEFAGNIGGAVFDMKQSLQRRVLYNTTFDKYEDYRKDFVLTSVALSESIIQFAEKMNDDR